VLKLNGDPASAAEVGKLAARIASEPSALTRRPDFFQVIPREVYNQLKSDFTGHPARQDTLYKHMSLTSRDFEWSSSCSRVSEDCNLHAQSASYRKGDYVQPEDLAAVSRDLLLLDQDQTAGAAAGEEEGLPLMTEEEKEAARRGRERAEQYMLARTESQGGRVQSGRIRGLLASMGSSWRSLFGGGSDGGAAGEGIAVGIGAGGSSGSAAARAAATPRAAVRSAEAGPGAAAAGSARRRQRGIAAIGLGLIVAGLVVRTRSQR
jgi:hypothetical protein